MSEFKFKVVLFYSPHKLGFSMLGVRDLKSGELFSVERKIKGEVLTITKKEGPYLQKKDNFSVREKKMRKLKEIEFFAREVFARIESFSNDEITNP